MGRSIGEAMRAFADAPGWLGTQLHTGETLVLRGDPALPRTDAEGRLLVYVRDPSGIDVGHELVADGFVRVDRTRSFARLALYTAAEAAARAESWGVWSCGPEPLTADLALTATSPAEVGFGTPFTLGATVTNNGPGPARLVVFTWQGSFPVVGVSRSPTSPDQSGNGTPGPYDLGGCATTATYAQGHIEHWSTTVRCNDPYLATGASWQIQITTPGEATEVGEFSTGFAVTTCTADPDPANNTATIVTGVLPQALDVGAAGAAPTRG